MTGDGDREGSSASLDVLALTIKGICQRLDAFGAATNALADAAGELIDALERAELVADALRDRPEHAEALYRFDELRAVAYHSLEMLAMESPPTDAASEGPPARGSSPQILPQHRARRDTLADSPHALRDAPGDACDAAPGAPGAANSAMAPAPETPLSPNARAAGTGDAAGAPAVAPDEPGMS